MPLTEFQSQVALVLAQQRTPDSYLAGGAALHIEPESLRYSNDLDYFNDSVARVSSAFDADRQALQNAHYQVEVLLQLPGFVRVLVRQKAEATKVEWVHDTAFRFLPVLKSEQAGYLLHPVDLAINKLLALVGRDEPRDYLDTVYAHSHILSLGGLVWAACGKDPGFTPEFLLDLLRRKGRYRPEDFARLHLHRAPDLEAAKRTWLDALEEAALFVRGVPPEDVGCLYYHPQRAMFVGALPLPSDVVRHFGRPGGLLPIVSDE
jgi:hypothetical protein